MNISIVAGGKEGSGVGAQHRRGESPHRRPDDAEHARTHPLVSVSGLIDSIAPCPWPAHAGGLPSDGHARTGEIRHPIYTPDERIRRDRSPWTLVQGILAPLQFLAFAVSLGCVLRYLATGRGYEIATASILVKTAALYAIMVTGSIWEKDVFGRWLFAPAFFWEDAISMLVIFLQTVYVAALVFGWASPRQQMLIAIAAYTAYVINAAQFLLKLRAARLEGGGRVNALPGAVSGTVSGAASEGARRPA